MSVVKCPKCEHEFEVKDMTTIAIISVTALAISCFALGHILGKIF